MGERERGVAAKGGRKSDYVDLDRHLVQFSRGRHTAPGEALFSVHAVLVKFWIYYAVGLPLGVLYLYSLSIIFYCC